MTSVPGGEGRPLPRSSPRPALLYLISTMPPELPQDYGPERDRAHFAARLRQWRTGHGLMLKEVASRFGVAEATWSRWEAGERFPSPGNLRLLAEFIGVPICCFFYQDPSACPNCTKNPPPTDTPSR